MSLFAWSMAVPGCGTSNGSDAPEPSGNEITVKVFLDGAPSPTGTKANADLVAVQDGEGPWTAIAGADGVYRFHVKDERYGVAVGCKGRRGGTAFYYQTVSETVDLAVDGCDTVADTAELFVNSQGALDWMEVWVGDSSGFFVPGIVESLSVDKGTADVYARTYISDSSGDLLVRAYRSPSLDVQTDQALAIDMTNAPPVVHHPLMINEIDQSGLWVVTSSYVAPHGRGFRTVERARGLRTSYAAVDAPARVLGDIARVEASETDGTTEPNEPLRTRSAFHEMAIPAAVTLDPPDFLTATAPTVDVNAVSQLSVTLPIQTSVLGHSLSRASFTTGMFAIRHLDMFVRPGWARGEPSVTLRVPDLRDLDAWNADMALGSRTQVDWSISVTDQNTTFEASVADGRRGVRSAILGNVSPPRYFADVPPCGQQPCGAPPVPQRAPLIRSVP